MNALKLIEELSRHSVMKNDTDIQMQLGLPFLEKKGDKLFICFKPHKETFIGGIMDYYKPLYEIIWAYPSKRLVLFRDLYYENEGAYAKPIKSLSNKILISKLKYFYENVYNECTRCLDSWDKNGTLSDVALKKYNAALEEAIMSLGLDCIYFQ